MTITYLVNGRTICAGQDAGWTPILSRTGYNSKPAYNSAGWFDHVWNIPIMNMDDFQFLEALRSDTITLQTTDQSAPNTQKAYATARLMSVDGRQNGLQVVGVTVRMRVQT